MEEPRRTSIDLKFCHSSELIVLLSNHTLPPACSILIFGIWPPKLESQEYLRASGTPTSTQFHAHLYS